MCSENFLTYKNGAEQESVRVPIPRRVGDLTDPERGQIIVCHATLKTKHVMFFLVQTEQGDLFRVKLEVQDDTVWVVSVQRL